MKKVGLMLSILFGSGLVVSADTNPNGKTLVDFFLPMEPQGELISEGIWGEACVLPRDVNNGLEDPKLENWCYWDGNIVKDKDGKYHMYASRWTQTADHSKGWNIESKGMHAISENLLGPYKDLGETWPQWKDGLGGNVIGLKMTDGRYALVSSEVTPGDVFVSDSPYGPWKYLGEIQIDPNGFYAALARYDELDFGAVRAGTVGHMANVMVITRPDGRYMIIARNCAPMISETGILGPYKIMANKAWRNVPGIPQFKNEDPTVWYSDGLYHIVVNHYAKDETYHLTSEDGIHNWKVRGLAYHKDKHIFRYTDGTVNEWYTVQRPTVYTENGLVKAFNFSVIDVHKGQDAGNDNNGSKIVVVPFDGEAFNKHITELVRNEHKTADATPPPSPWQSVDLGETDQPGNTGFEAEFNTLRVKAPAGKESVRFVYQKMSGDVSATVQVLSHDISAEPIQAGLMFRKSLDSDAQSVFASISRPGGFAFEKSGNAVTQKKLNTPYWLRLEKRGSNITAYISSSNRMNWEKAGETTVEFGNEFYAGMVATSAGLARFKDPDFHVWGEPNKEGIIRHTFPDVIPADGKITFEVEFECRQTSDVFVEMEHVATRRKFPPLQQRLKPKGVMELTYDVGPLNPGDAYWFVIKTLPLHGHESMAYQSMFKKVHVEK